MPIYEYRCRDCVKETEELRKMSERNETVICLCGGTMDRIYSVPSLAIWNAERPFPNAVKFGDGKFPTKRAYETHLKMNDMAETRTDGKNKSRVPRSLRGA